MPDPVAAANQWSITSAQTVGRPSRLMQLFYQVLITSGTLDDTAFVKPTRNIFCDEAQSWVLLTQNTQKGPS